MPIRFINNKKTVTLNKNLLLSDSSSILVYQRTIPDSAPNRNKAQRTCQKVSNLPIIPYSEREKFKEYKGRRRKPTNLEEILLKPYTADCFIVFRIS